MSTQPGFSSPRVDFGIVVSDIEKAAAFYTKVLGFKEVEGFGVPEVMGRESGLAERPFHVRVFQAGDGPDATNVKIMSFAGLLPPRPDNRTIHSALGIRYLTLYVADNKAATQRCRAAGAEIMAHGPYLLPEGFPEGVYLTCVRDPDGNIIELVGPSPD